MNKQEATKRTTKPYTSEDRKMAADQTTLGIINCFISYLATNNTSTLVITLEQDL